MFVFDPQPAKPSFVLSVNEDIEDDRDIEQIVERREEVVNKNWNYIIVNFLFININL